MKYDLCQLKMVLFFFSINYIILRLKCPLCKYLLAHSGNKGLTIRFVIPIKYYHLNMI